MIKIESEVQTMHLADVLHQLELACYLDAHLMERYRQALCGMLKTINKEREVKEK